MMKYNHNRPLSDFEEQLDLIRANGFNPIAVSQMYFEDTFVFKTTKEAKEAYELLEKGKDRKLVGWWYGKKDFLKTIEEYEADNDGYSKVLVHWL